SEAVLNDVTQYRLDVRRVTVEMGDSIIGILYGTYDALRRTLVQLVNNALKFSGGRVTLRITAQAGLLLASVTDHGIGIPASEREFVFQPMYRASNVGDVSGSGLGLALADKLMAGVGATLDIDSREGEGTTVTLHWPLTPTA